MERHRVITSDGVRLNVESAGAGRPILLINGYTATAAAWAWQVEAIVAAGYRAVALDRRWHGASDRPAHGQRIARHAADVREVIAALALDRPLLVGASMGASVCWSYLDLFGADRVAGMVGVDQTPCMVNKPGWGHGFYGLTEDNVGRFFAHGVPQTGRGRAPEEARPAMRALAEKAGGAALSSDIVADTRALLDDHARQDWRDVCATTRCPTLLVAGRDSQLWPCAHVDAVAGNPNARTATIGDCGHAVAMDRPEPFNRLLLDFARDVLV